MQAVLRHLGNTGQDIGKPGLRVDIVELGGADKGVHEGRPIAAAVGAGEQPGLAPQRYTAQRPLRCIVGEADAAVVEETGEAVPAVARPTMRFVPIKTPEQQSVLMLHRTRRLFVRQRTTLINAIRAHLAEFGIVAGVGRNGVEVLLELIAKGEDERVPPPARECLMALAAQLQLVKRQILGADRRILACHRSSPISKRLEAIPGVRPLIATALVASVPDPHVFRSGPET